MRVILAMLRAQWLAASSYRMAMLFSLGGLAFTVVPLYFVAGALQGTMATAVAAEGGQYFAFVLCGMIGTTVITEAMSSLPSNVGGAATSGTLDTLLMSPTPPPVLFASLSAYGMAWTLVRCALLLGGGVALGATIHWARLPAAVAVLGLLTLAYLPFGLLMCAAQVAFRTSGPVMNLVLLGSTLLGGVYYPVSVIPSWLRVLADVVPLGHGLRAFRRVLLEGEPLLATWPELRWLGACIVVLGALGIAAVAAAFRYARRTGGLSQY